jgi:Rod binding domain-containing protein
VKITNNTAGSLPIQNQNNDNDSPIRQAAQGMEANFIREMMKAMRETVDESEETKNNRGLQIFRGMLDDEYAEKAARNPGLGVADLIVKQLTEAAESKNTGPANVRTINESDLLRK